MKQMFDVLLFFFLIMILYAFIGMLVIGDLDGEHEFDKVK